MKEDIYIKVGKGVRETSISEPEKEEKSQKVPAKASNINDETEKEYLTGNMRRIWWSLDHLSARSRGLWS